MLNTFRYTVLSLLRSPGVLVWLFVFPLAMSTIFMMMFAGIDSFGERNTINIAVVEPDNTQDGLAFRQFIDSISDSNNNDSMFSVTYADTSEDAQKLVTDNINSEVSYAGYVKLVDGLPNVWVANNASTADLQYWDSSILTLVMDQYTANSELFKTIIKENPAMLASPDVLTSLFDPIEATKQVSLTHSNPVQSARYFFALLAMAALFGSTAGLLSMHRLRANASNLGARRSLGATTHMKTVSATILATWCVCLVSLLVTYAYMRFVVGVNFGDRDLLCMFAIGLASLAAVAMGCAVAAIPRLSLTIKDGILSGFICFTSLLTGLYGQPAMKLADYISDNLPALDYINPTAQVAQMFYSILYYDALQPFVLHAAILLVMSLLFFCLAANSIRRQRYASL